MMALLACDWHAVVLTFLAISCGHSLAKASDSATQPPLEEQAPTLGPRAPPRPPPLVAAAATAAVAGMTKVQATVLPKKQKSTPTRRPTATRRNSRVLQTDSHSLLVIPVVPCIAVTLKVALLVGGAAWACKQFCPRQPGGFFSVPAHWAAPMGLPTRGCYISVGDSPKERVPPRECTAAVAEAPKKARPLLAPLRILGGAVQERLATLTSASTRASSRRSFSSEDIFRTASEDQEEARGLLWGNSRQPADDGDEEEDEAALTALLKLRPSLADSLGDEADYDTDDGFAGPLTGNGRMGLLSR